MRNPTKFLAILLASLSLQLTAQNHYVVEYDRINDEVRYFQVFVDHGKLIEQGPIKNITIQEGDILQARAVNVNQLAFEPHLTINNVDRPASPLNGVVSLLSNIASSRGILGSFMQMVTMTDIGNEGLTSRGANGNLSADDQLVNLMSEIQLDLTNAESYHSIIAEELPKVIYAPDLTKKEIQDQLITIEEKASSIPISTIYDDIDEEITQLNVLLSSAEFGNDVIVQSADDLIQQWEGLQTVVIDDLQVNPIELARVALDSTDFEHSRLYIVPASDALKSDISVDFIFDSKSEKDNYGGNIYSHKVLSINRRQPALRIVNGLVIVVPLSNSSTFDTVELGDSVLFASKSAPPTSLNFSALLQYQFAPEGSLIPSLNLGLALPISNFSETSLDGGIQILTGAGLQFKSMPNLTLTTGIAWRSNEALPDQLNYNTMYNVNDLEAQNLLIVDDDPYSGSTTLETTFNNSTWDMSLSFGLSIMVN